MSTAILNDIASHAKSILTRQKEFFENGAAAFQPRLIVELKCEGMLPSAQGLGAFAILRVLKAFARMQSDHAALHPGASYRIRVRQLHMS